MKIVTLLETIQTAKQNNEKLFNTLLNNIPLFADYNENIDNLILVQYGSRKIAFYDDIINGTPLEYIRMLFNGIITMNMDNYAKIENLLNIEYNPLENYDRNEEFFGSESTTVSPKGSETTTNTPSGKDTSVSYEFPYDSETFLEKVKNETSFSDDRKNETKLEFSEDRETTTTTSYGTGDDKRYNHLHGNIGTTKTQEMYSDELSLRRRQIMYEKLCDIIKQVTF